MHIFTKCIILPAVEKGKHRSLLAACLGKFQTLRFSVVRLGYFPEAHEMTRMHSMEQRVEVEGIKCVQGWPVGFPKSSWELQNSAYCSSQKWGSTKIVCMSLTVSVTVIWFMCLPYGTTILQEFLKFLSLYFLHLCRDMVHSTCLINVSWMFMNVTSRDVS